MLFASRFWPGIEDGSVTVAFRRWRRPTVKAGGTLRTPGGFLAIDEVTPIDAADVTPGDARAAGYPAVADVLAALRPDGTLYRVRFHRLGTDPRVELRERAQLAEDDLSELRAALGRLDWAGETLQLIAARPAVVSTDLAAVVGVDRPVFKRRVASLKALGLTESLGVGYRLSPRGEAALRALFAEP